MEVEMESAPMECLLRRALGCAAGRKPRGSSAEEASLWGGSLE